MLPFSIQTDFLSEMKSWQQQQRKQLESITLENQHLDLGLFMLLPWAQEIPTELNQGKPLPSTT